MIQFREHKNLFAKTITAQTEVQLDNMIHDWAGKYELIDLQFSTHCFEDRRGEQVVVKTRYCALMLLKGEKK